MARTSIPIAAPSRRDIQPTLREQITRRYTSRMTTNSCWIGSAACSPNVTETEIKKGAIINRRIAPTHRSNGSVTAATAQASLAGCGERDAGAGFSLKHARDVLFEQVNRNRQKNDILHQEGHNAGHRWKSRSRIPAIRREWNDGDRPDESERRTDGSQNSQSLVPKPQKQQRAECPFGNAPETNWLRGCQTPDTARKSADHC